MNMVLDILGRRLPGASFAPIPGYLGYYACDLGSIWSALRCGRRRAGCEKSPEFSGSVRRLVSTPIAYGYHAVGLRRESKTITRYVHRLILEAFVGPCPDGMEGCHGDGDLGNNALANLRWDTPLANKADNLIHGTRLMGSTVGNSKLTEDLVGLAFSLRDQGVTHREIASRLDVARSTISNILAGKKWKHVVPRSVVL